MQRLLQQIEPRTLLLLMVAVTLLVIAALGSYVIWPEVRGYRQSLSTLAVLEEVTAHGDSLEQEMAVLEGSVDALDRQLHGDMANLPDNQMEAFIIGRLQGISWRNHVELLRVTPGNGSVVRVFEEVLFDVSVSGDYFDLFNWLQDLGDELGFVVVKQFDLQPATARDSGEQLKANFTIVSYREVTGA